MRAPAPAELVDALRAEQAEDPVGMAELVMAALARFGGVLAVLPPVELERAIHTNHSGIVHRAVVGDLDITVLSGGSWWIDHRATGQTLYDTDVHNGGLDYLAAFRWIQGVTDHG